MNLYPQRLTNQELNAANVVELSIDHELVIQCYKEVRDLLDPGHFEGIRTSGTTGISLYSLSSGWNGDLRWVSAGNREGFAFFDRYFEKLKIAEKNNAVLGDGVERIMYSGFFVVRSRMTESYYHEDYCTGVGMDAMTMMTPLTETNGQGDLLYTDIAGEERVYKYKTGTAIAFGSDFLHSTQPFQSAAPYIFLCFTYGVRNEERWKLISETVTEQGIIYRHPELGIVEMDEEQEIPKGLEGESG